jgi:hypothetical protein
MSGYSDVAARRDMETFFSLIEKPRGVHLCGNPDWDFLLGLDLDILSLDVYSNGEVFVSYASSIKKFLDRGGMLVWGIIPTNADPFEKESIDSLENRLIEMWAYLERKGIDRNFLMSRSMLSPATCCLVNPDIEKTVEKSFTMVNQLSTRLRKRNGIL